MAKIIPPQDIPSELLDKFSAIGGVARPNDVAQRRYPWRIKQPGTPWQVDVWHKFLSASRCFGEQTPEQREWWYEQSQVSGLFYYTYFMKQTLTLLHQGIWPDWCETPYDVCYEANVLPEVADPPWFGHATEENSVSGGILTMKHPSWYDRKDVLGPSHLGNTIKVKARPRTAVVSALEFWLSDGLWKALCNVYWGGVYERFHPSEVILMDTTDAFHTYKLALKNGNYKISIDGVLKLTGSATPNPSNRVLFSAWTEISYWDYVCYSCGK